MPGKNNENVSELAMIPILLMGLAVLPLTVMDAAAQAEPRQQATPVSDAEANTRQSISPSAREAALDARQLLKSAFTDEDVSVRWNALRAVRNLSEPWIADLALPRCASPDLIERVLALETVANSDPVKGREAFITALSSSDRSVRLRALLGLVAIGDAVAVPDLTMIMREDPDPDLQAAAARGLGEIGDVKASIPLYEAIVESPYPPVREQAVMALMALGDKAIGVYLVEHLRADSGPGQAELLKLLALVPEPALVEHVVPYLEHRYREVRIQAAATILSILERSRRLEP